MQNYKKVYLYKLGRFQEDFEYIFPKIKIKNYIVTDSVKIYKGKKCINLKDIQWKNGKAKYLIVICDRKNININKKFKKLGLIENQDYMYLEDFGIFLDAPVTEHEIKLTNELKNVNKIDIDSYHMSSRDKNSELFKKMIYTDPKYDLNCQEPFRYAQIEVHGFVYSCCPTVIGEHIGNVLFDSVKNVWNSTRANLIRLSIINKTYAFCNLEYCRLKDNSKGIIERAENIKVSKVPDYLAVSFDRSCNLQCKSCRNCKVDYNDDPDNKKVNEIVNNQIIKSKWLNKTKQLVLATNGEVFYSKMYQNILFSKKLKNLNTIIIHTNATLLTPRKLDKLCKQCDKNKIKNVIINASVDSVSKTYEKLRFGGNVDILKQNLKAISEARKEGKLYTINMITVLQKDNYKELPEIAKFAIELGFDRLDVQFIGDWGTYTQEEFKEISMLDDNGNPKPELEKVLKDPIFQSDKIEFVGSLFKTDKYMD